MSRPTDALTADQVRAATFEKAKWNRRGYQPKSVDDLRALVARRLDGRGHLCADDIRGIRFPKAPLGRRGYDEDQVDAFMAAVLTTMAGLGPEDEDRP